MTYFKAAKNSIEWWNDILEKSVKKTLREYDMKKEKELNHAISVLKNQDLVWNGKLLSKPSLKELKEAVSVVVSFFNENKTYTEADLVDFGNYLLSNDRKELFKSHPNPIAPLKERLKKVHQEDIDNFKPKELTQKEVESLGFVFFEKKESKSVFLNNDKSSRDERIYFGELFEGKRYIAVENNCGQFYFMGWIKNKKELKKVLSQVGVCFTK